MELFDASQQDVSYHINQIYADGEQDPERTHKKFLLVRQEGALVSGLRMKPPELILIFIGHIREAL